VESTGALRVLGDYHNTLRDLVYATDLEIIFQMHERKTKTKCAGLCCSFHFMNDTPFSFPLLHEL
jgi:hypothetical protein